MNEEKQMQPSSETDSVDAHDRVAEAYLGLMGQQFMRKTQSRIHWICRQIQGKQVLDVGCSQGIVPILLAREGLKVIGIDSSPKSIDEANHYLENEPKQVRKNVSFINTDFLSWDVHDLKVDTVVMSEVLEHLIRPESFIEAAAHILAKKGRLIVTVPFGVNDFVDHKHTFYLLEPLRLISKYFDPANIEVLGNWLGIVADRRAGAERTAEIFRPTVALMEKLESAFYQTERVLQDELSLARTKRDEANQKYRLANEQIAALKQRVAQEEKAHQAAKQTTLQQQSIQAAAEGQAKSVVVGEESKSLLQLETELEATRNKLAEANQKYRGANEQIIALKQRVTQEETVRQKAEQSLVQATTQLEQTQSYLQEERAGLLQQVAQLSQQEHVSRAASEEVSKNLLRLEAELEGTRSKLGEANQKYRGAGEQITALKQRVMQEEMARQTAEQSLAQVSDESAKALLRLEAELEMTRNKLGEANQKYRGANEQFIALKQRVTEEETARQMAEQALVQATIQLEQSQSQLQAERTALQQQLVQLTAEGQAKRVAVQETEGKLLRLETELEGTRNKLGEANQKYRGANEQITALKQRVTEEEAVRQTAEQALAQATTQLEQSQSQLQAERAVLQQQLVQVTAEGQAKQVAADEAAKRLLHLEAEVETGRSKLGETNQKYRGANEQIIALKQRVTEEEAARQTTEQALAQATIQWEQTQHNFQAERAGLQQQLVQLTVEGQAKQVAVEKATKNVLRLEAELDATGSKLAEANQKYRGANEQIVALKQRVTEEETARQTAEQALALATTQWEQTQGHLQEERTALQQQLTQLTAEGQAKLVEAEEAAKNFVRLEGELEGMHNRLEEGSQKYRGANEQITALKQRVTEEETARLTAEQALVQATSQLEQAQSRFQMEHAALQQQLVQMTAEGQAKWVAVQEAEGNLLRRETELEGTRSKLGEANQKYRSANEQIAALKQRVTEEETARQAAEQALALATTQWEQTQGHLQKERTALQQQLTQLTAEAQEKLVETEEATKHLLRLEGELESAQSRLGEANQKYRSANEQITALKQRVTEEETARRTIEQELRHTASQLEQANAKYRLVTARQLPELKNKLEQQKAIAERQLIKTRSAISFRLGYLLIHNFKSMNGVLSLPSALWTLRNEAIRRRKQETFAPGPSKLPSSSRPSPVAARPNVFIEPRPPEPSSNGHAISADIIAVLPAQPASAATPKSKLNIACIMDEFTFGSFEPEAILHQLTPNNWQAELESANPDLLFIESAWRGKDELWGNKVGHTSMELQGIVKWCSANRIPTVFWCKEDPIHFETFLNTATLFDYVFTTDIDCIHRYKAALGHERVYLLPFACQPATNNPIETYQRKDAFCFAGAYYVRYPERTRDLGDFVMELPAFRPLEIYDRNYGKNDPNYQFPAEYQRYIVGTLPFDQIDKAYKGYRYAINLNSIKQSQSMFARRVFELLASNTITISNFSRGLRLLFGDLVITTDSGTEIVRRLNRVADNEEHSRKLRLAGLRKVMSEHTYAHRLAYVVSKVRGKAVEQSLPHIAVLAHAGTRREIEAIQAHYQRQRYANTALYVVVGSGVIPPPSDDARVHIINSAQAKNIVVGGLDNQAEMVAGMVAEDYYGPNYLEDIALATRYTQADLIGKAARYTWESGRCQLKQPDDAYRPVQCLPARAAAIRLPAIAKENILEWVQSLGTRQLQVDQGLAIDEFNYCEQGAAADSVQVGDKVDDLPGLNTGISIEDLLAKAESIAPESTRHDDCPRLTGRQLAEDFGKSPSDAITLAVEAQSWRVGSTLPDGKHEYLYATSDHSLEELGFSEQLKVYFEVTPGMNIQLVVQFLDAQKQKISHVIKHANCNQEAVIPPGTEWIRFGLRFYAGGNAEIQGLVLGRKNLQPAELIGQAEHLLLTNHYPSYDDLYRNGFVHSRICGYRERGVQVDVFRLRPDEPVSYHEFEDVNVITASQEALHQMLSNGRYKTVLVHFLSPAMWAVLQHHIDRIKVLVWMHGAEFQPWHRRDFDHQTEEQRTGEKVRSDKRMAFWRELLQPMPANLKLIFVSRYFAEEVMEDLGFRIPKDHYAIMHNPIHTDVFRYEKKSLDQRKKALSISSYASRKYATDLNAKAIELLSNKPWFYDMEFRLIGDGPLFENTVALLRKFKNVYIEQRFLKHDEIAALHKEYGIFLCPTRWDSHGVSRDEAMSSGLVPVTNAVAAIPEFVDDHCGIVAPAEDAEAMARGIAMLYEQPLKFSAMSEAASKRVRDQRGAQKVICAELALLSDEPAQNTGEQKEAA